MLDRFNLSFSFLFVVVVNFLIEMWIRYKFWDRVKGNCFASNSCWGDLEGRITRQVRAEKLRKPEEK